MAAAAAAVAQALPLAVGHVLQRLALPERHRVGGVGGDRRAPGQIRKAGPMDRIRIVGGQALKGTIPISGAKNAALPLMIASLLTRETLTLENLPRLADISALLRILQTIDAPAVTAMCGELEWPATFAP